jgi:hypothetical protein
MKETPLTLTRRQFGVFLGALGAAWPDMGRALSNSFSVVVGKGPSANGDVTLVKPKIGLKDLDPQFDPINPWRTPGGLNGGVSPWLNDPPPYYAHMGISAYSGAAFSAAYGAQGGYVVMGGGHANYYGNEVYVYDIAENVWMRINFPYENEDRTGVMKSYFDYVQANPYQQPAHRRGRVRLPGTPGYVDPPGLDPRWGDWDQRVPHGTHTYDLIDVIPPEIGGGTKGALILMTSGGYGANGNLAHGMWKCPLDTGKWQRLTLCTARNVGSGAGGVCFDPGRKLFYQLHRDPACFAYDPLTNTYNKMSSVLNVVGVDTTSTFHVKADLLIHMQTYLNSNPKKAPNFRMPKLYAWSPVTKRMSQLTVDGEIPARSGDRTLGFNSRTMGVEYCPVNDCLYSVSTSRTSIYDGVSQQLSVWRCQPPAGASTLDDYLRGTWTWSLDNKDNYTGVVLKPSDMPHLKMGGGYNRFRWVPALRRFIGTTYNADGGIILIKPKGI